jgi:hypothetical protein
MQTLTSTPADMGRDRAGVAAHPQRGRCAVPTTTRQCRCQNSSSEVARPPGHPPVVDFLRTMARSSSHHPQLHRATRHRGPPSRRKGRLTPSPDPSHAEKVTTIGGDGDWNHALSGWEFAGSTGGRNAILVAVATAELHIPTAGLAQRPPGLLSIDHIAIPTGWAVKHAARTVAEADGAQLSDHDL